MPLVVHEIPKTGAQKVFEYLQWGFILLFAAPTTLILASWNSLPGDSMFGVKRTFEQSLLLVLRPSYDAQTTLNAQYTKRRMEEAKVLLAKNQSAKGLSYLSQQVVATKHVIQNAPTQEKKREAAKQYIATLQGVSQELKTQQQKQPTVAAKPKVRPTATIKPIQQLASGSNQQQVQAQLNQTTALLNQLQTQLQVQQQSQALLAQLNAQALQLQQLQQQLQTVQQPQQVQQIQDQIEVQVQQIEDIQQEAAVQESQQDTSGQTAAQDTEAVGEELAEAQTQVEETITELQTIVEDTPGNSGDHGADANTSNQGDNGNRNQENNNRAIQESVDGNGTGQNN